MCQMCNVQLRSCNTSTMVRMGTLTSNGHQSSLSAAGCIPSNIQSENYNTSGSVLQAVTKRAIQQ